MATGKITKSLRSSIAAEKQNLDNRSNSTASATINKPTVANGTETELINSISAMPAKPQAITTPAKAKRAAAKSVAKATTKPIVSNNTAKPASTTSSKEITATNPNTTTAAAKSPKVHTAAATKNKINNNSAKTVSVKTALPWNPVTPELVHDKLHKLVERNYNLYTACLEHLQTTNDNIHDYLDKLVNVDSIDGLIKLNMSFLSSTPLSFQKMLAQNKNIFSDFFKFATTKE
jgi:hypothetical protein